MPPTQYENVVGAISDLRKEMAVRFDKLEADVSHRFTSIEGRVRTIEDARLQEAAAAEALAGQAQERTAFALSRRQWVAVLLPLSLAALGGPGDVLQALVMAGKFLVGGQP